MPPLPVPSADASAASKQLVELIAAEIKAQGSIDFARYMSLALYAPGLGYYSDGAAKFGSDGDFVTAPEISPLFGRSLARQVAQVLAITGGDILELGAGSGRLACDVLAELLRLDCLPGHYYILEVSADLRQRQRSLIARTLPDIAERIIWLEHLPTGFTGCIVANEVLDAVPVDLLHWREDGIYRRCVAWENDRLVWCDRILAAGALREAAEAIAVPAGYISEIGLAAQALIKSLAQSLTAGAILMIDYGFGEREYYHPQRDRGTIMCHYRQHAHSDPFYLPGLQDITAHVDFTAMALAGLSQDLTLAGYTGQAQFLINCGITELLAQTSASDAAKYAPQAAAVQKLLSPAEMGELFKAIAWSKGIDDPLLGFSAGDQRRRL